ncbi:hypothetical protein ACFYPN_21985 [Streptomyces sp. NPDC005576]|uniref:hypothetical protein n=1 Tax=Streptomyces sp. NPDC005576 TaxID=3364726 RepID=UPI003699C07C
MAPASIGRPADSGEPAAPGWRELATVTDAQRIRWRGHRARTRWAECGRAWDAVAVEPMTAGLDALTAMGAGTRDGYRVLVDHLRDRLYVLVPTGSRDVFAGIPKVRVLSVGHQLLAPIVPQDGTAAADWISHPDTGTPSALVAAAPFADRLRELTALSCTTAVS